MKLAVLILLIANTALAGYPPGKIQRQLEPAMSVTQVVQLLGEPDAASYDSKNDQNPERLVFKYATGSDRLVVTFVRVSGQWGVVSWSAY